MQNRKPCLYELGNSDIKMSEKKKATKGALTRFSLKKKKKKEHWLDQDQRIRQTKIDNFQTLKT